MSPPRGLPPPAPPRLPPNTPHLSNPVSPMSIIPRPPANPPPQVNELGKSLMSEYMEAPPPPSKQGGTNLEALFERKSPFLAQDSNALEQLFRTEKDIVGGRQTALPSLVSQRRSSSPGPEVQRRRGEQQQPNGFWGLVQVCNLPQRLLAYSFFSRDHPGNHPDRVSLWRVYRRSWMPC